MKNLLGNSETVKIVGIIKADEEAVSNNQNYGMVGYTHELMEHVVNKTNESDIVKAQLENKNINVFTGKEFSTNTTFNMEDLSPEEMMAFQNMSQEELAAYMKNYSENMTSTYEENARKLGIADLDNPE
jgi:putative ABC transport system permease protein